MATRWRLDTVKRLQNNPVSLLLKVRVKVETVTTAVSIFFKVVGGSSWKPRLFLEMCPTPQTLTKNKKKPEIGKVNPEFPVGMWVFNHEHLDAVVASATPVSRAPGISEPELGAIMLHFTARPQGEARTKTESDSSHSIKKGVWTCVL